MSIFPTSFLFAVSPPFHIMTATCSGWDAIYEDAYPRHLKYEIVLTYNATQELKWACFLLGYIEFFKFCKCLFNSVKKAYANKDPSLAVWKIFPASHYSKAYIVGDMVAENWENYRKLEILEDSDHNTDNSSISRTV
jgi:hypothetical protein